MGDCLLVDINRLLAYVSGCPLSVRRGLRYYIGYRCRLLGIFFTKKTPTELYSNSYSSKRGSYDSYCIGYYHNINGHLAQKPDCIGLRLRF